MPMPATKTREFEWRDQDFEFLANLLYEKTGIVLNEKKKEMMYGRLVRRLRALDIKSFADYCDYLRGSSGNVELGTGCCSAFSGSQIRAAKRQPSGMGIQMCFIVCILCGNSVLIFIRT